MQFSTFYGGSHRSFKNCDVSLMGRGGGGRVKLCKGRGVGSDVASVVGISGRG